MSDNHTQTEHRQPDLHRENGTVLRCIGPWTLLEIRTLAEQLATFSWPEEPELVPCLINTLAGQAASNS